MLKFVKRLHSTSTLVKSDLPSHLTKVATQNNYLYE